MVRKCSHCGKIGHNSRTCINFRAGNVSSVGGGGGGGGGGVRLFGVQLDISSSSTGNYSASSASSSSIAMMKKSFSMDCFLASSPLGGVAVSSTTPSPTTSSLSSSRVSNSINEISDNKISIGGYLSDGLFGQAQERKKGLPWTEEEHRRFLTGLEKLGKGDWRGISRTYVTTRTPTQVASHAQKYFLRQASLIKKKRRSSLFDMVGGSSNIAQNHVNGSSNLSRTNSYEDQEAPHGDYNNLYMIDLNSLGQEQSTRIFPNNHKTPFWPYGSMKMNNASTSKGGAANHAISPPDLELTLAAPKPVDQNKPSPNSLLTADLLVLSN